jgi:fructose-specific phosphotransferase system IIC component
MKDFIIKLFTLKAVFLGGMFIGFIVGYVLSENDILTEKLSKIEGETQTNEQD